MPGLPPELERLPVGVLRVGRQGCILAANTCVGDWLGRAPASLVGHPVDELLSRAGRVLYHTHLLPTLHLHGDVQELSLSLRAVSGNVHVLCCASLVEGPDGQVAQLVLSPMRERLRIEAELARVQRAADAAPLVLFECVRDVDGQAWLSYASAGLISLYGLTPESVHFSDGPWLDRVHEDDRAALLAARDASGRALSIWSSQFRARVANAAWRWHRLHAQPYADPDGRMIWYGAIVDVSEQIAVENAERERDTAERASRSKSDFLARMSHELRTPLNAIIGFSRLLEQAPGGHDAQARQRLGIIHGAGQQLLRLIDEVLDITRIESGHLHLDLQPVRLAPLVEQVCLSLEPARLARGIGLELQLESDLTARADEGRLRQVLNNLVSNAVKYTRPAGHVAVQMSLEAEWVRMQVRDDGPGLSAAQQRQLFQPFNRLGAEGSRVEGTGLGLVITRHLLHAMGSALQLQSNEGEGCCFSFTLPRAAVPDAAAPRPQRPPAPLVAAAGCWRLLYAEDDPVNALLMEAVLAGLPGVTLRVATSGDAACELARADPPDLLLLDMHLPDIDGRQLLQRLRADPRLAAVPAVAVSADAMPDEISRTLAAGFAAYWTKPLDIERVPDDLRALLARRTAGAAP
ncbi:ATP-binding protein [Roseateles sp. DC23W]|uniref:histidine kinase n=1 Tax=Pelomonas dachongensis TaxID=3299029 RepID=A0ABW7EKY9_9BURK